MRSLAFWAVFLLAVAALVVLSQCDGRGSGSVFTSNGAVTASNQECAHLVKPIRKLKVANYNGNTSNQTKSISLDMADYPRFDPAPSSKAAIKNGPIEHGTPLMPCIPCPAPPKSPQH